MKHIGEKNSRNMSRASVSCGTLSGNLINVQLESLEEKVQEVFRKIFEEING